MKSCSFQISTSINGPLYQGFNLSIKSEFLLFLQGQPDFSAEIDTRSTCGLSCNYSCLKFATFAKFLVQKLIFSRSNFSCLLSLSRSSFFSLSCCKWLLYWPTLSTIQMNGGKCSHRSWNNPKFDEISSFWTYLTTRMRHIIWLVWIKQCCNLT